MFAFVVYLCVDVCSLQTLSDRPELVGMLEGPFVLPQALRAFWQQEERSLLSNVWHPVTEPGQHFNLTYLHASQLKSICIWLQEMGHANDVAKCTRFASVQRNLPSSVPAIPETCSRQIQQAASLAQHTHPIFDAIPLQGQQRKRSEFRHKSIKGAKACLLRHVCLQFGSGSQKRLETIVDGDKDKHGIIKCLEAWTGTANSSHLNIFGGAELVFLDRRNDEGRPVPHIKGTTLVYNSPVRCQMNLAVRLLAQLPFNLKLLHETTIFQVLVESSNTTDLFCSEILDLFSLSFPGYELPPFHSAAILQQPLTCFEGLTLIPQQVTYTHVRSVFEFFDLRRSVMDRCKLQTVQPTLNPWEQPSTFSSHSKARLLFLEPSDKRQQIENAPELCTHLRSTWDARVFVVPRDRDFCSQAAAVSWAQVLVTRWGAHVEYVGYSSADGTVLIVVYVPPLYIHKFDVSRLILNTRAILLDLVLTNDPPAVDESLVQVPPHNFHGDYKQFCRLIDFTTILHFPQCQQYFFPQRAHVTIPTLSPFLQAAVQCWDVDTPVPADAPESTIDDITPIDGHSLGLIGSVTSAEGIDHQRFNRFLKKCRADMRICRSSFRSAFPPSL